MTGAGPLPSIDFARQLLFHFFTQPRVIPEPVLARTSKGTNLLTALSYTRTKEKEQGYDEDMSLVSASQKGDTEAFESLVRKHQTRTMNIAFRMTGDYEDACEIVQDTFLSAFKAIKKFRGEARFSTWLYGICLNHARNRLKQRRGRTRYELYSLDDTVKDEYGVMGRDASTAEPSILEQIEQKELQDKVQKCIQCLDEHYREVVVLRDIEGFSYDEMCELLGLPEGTIKSRLFRARDALRTSLKTIIGDF